MLRYKCLVSHITYPPQFGISTDKADKGNTILPITQMKKCNTKT